jgi:hypothetical protein
MPSVEKNISSKVPLRGVPTIPDHIHRVLQCGYEPADSEQTQLAAAIAAGTAEIRRRHLDHLRAVGERERRRIEAVSKRRKVGVPAGISDLAADDFGADEFNDEELD